MCLPVKNLFTITMVRRYINDKILILNVGWLNKGNRTLVEATIETIKTIVPNAEFDLTKGSNSNEFEELFR